MKKQLYGLLAVIGLSALPVPAVAQEALERAALIESVLDRNPSIEAARQAWRAAAEREVQAGALDDPRLSTSIAPLSVGGESFGTVIEASQMFPYPGKRRLRAAVVRAEAETMESDYEATRLELATMASLLYDEYYRVARALEINAEHQRLLSLMKNSAEAQYVVGRASLQDPLQAEVELAHLMHEAIVLGRERGVIESQINELLHERPETPVAPPPHSLPLPPLPPSSNDLQEAALRQRPVLEATAARIRGAQAAVDLSELDFYPDFGVIGSYNSMWMDENHQWMVGIAINLPVQREKRRAAVREAEARLAAAESDRQRIEDQVRSAVDQAYRETVEAHHIIALQANRLIPAARDQVQAARAGFDSGRNSFLAVIESEKNLRTAELRYAEAVALYNQRLAQLDRAVGRMPFSSIGGGTR